MATHRFEAQIVEKTGTDLSGVRIEAWDARRANPQPVASAAVSPTGKVTVELTDEQIKRAFGEATPLVFFRVRGSSGVIASTERTLRWVASRDASGRIDVKWDRVLAALPEVAYTIEGTVADFDGPRTATISVKRIFVNPDALGGAAVDREVVTTIPDVVTTDARGRFKFRYIPPVPVPDLEISASLDPTGEAVLRVDKVQPQLTVALLADTDRDRGLTLHSDLLARIADTGPTPVNLASIGQEGAEHLAARTGRPVVELARLSAAKRLRDAAPTVPDAEETFFGLLSQREPEDELELYSRGIPALRRSLERAVADRHVKTLSSSDVDARIAALTTRGVNVLMTPVGGKLVAGELAATATDLTDTQHRAFVGHFLRHEGDADSLWSTVEDDMGEEAAKALRFTFELSPLTGSHKPLIQAIQAQRDMVSPTIPSLQKLAELGPTTINALIDALPSGQRVPPGTPGADLPAKTANYKAMVARRLEAQYRTDWVRGRTKPNPGDPATPLHAFLRDHTDFSFETDRSSKYAVNNPGAIADADLPEIQTFERLHHMAENFAETQALLALGLTSGQQFHDMGAVRGLKLLTDNGFTPTRGKQLIEKSCWMATSSSAAHNTFSPHIAGQIGTIPSYSVPEPPAAVADWESLFGSLDSCACAHCQSVYGPNAYLVDLLRFLGKQADGPSSTALARLLALRPDLQRLRLDCDTATTPLPQIDLVNEILELVVAETTPGTWPATTVATESTTLELAARPEIKYPAQFLETYGTTLRGATYPFNVPFDLWAEEARLVFEHLGVRRMRVIEVFETTNREPWMWAEELGITLDLRTKLLATIPGDDELYWGAPVGFPNSVVEKVSNFMRASRLSLPEVQELAAVDWGGSDVSIVVPEDNACDLDAMSITLAGADDAALWQLQKFLRLRSVLGWSTDDLAKATRAFAAPAFAMTAGGLTLLGTVHELVREWRLAVPEAVAFFADMDRDSGHAPSLFRRVFLEKRLHQQPLQPFVDVETTGTSATTLTQLRPSLVAALGVPARELEMMLATATAYLETGFAPLVNDPATTIGSLSQLYRVVKLARATSTPLRDLLVLLALTPGAPFMAPGSTTASSFRSFLRRLADVQASVLTVEEILYLLRHVISPAAKLGLGETTLEQMHVTLEDGISAAFLEGAGTSDPEGKTVTTLLPSIIDPVDATEILSFIEAPPSPATAARATLVAKLGFLFENATEAKTTLIPDPVPSDASVDLERRYTYLAQRLVRYDRARTFVIGWLSASFGIDAASAAFLATSGILRDGAADTTLLRAFLPAFGDAPGVDAKQPAGSRAARAARLMSMDKAALLVRKLRLSERVLRALYPDGAADPGGLPFLDLDALPVEALDADEDVDVSQGHFDALLRLMNLARLRDRWPAGEAIFDLFAAAVPPTTDVTLLDVLARQSAWNRGDLATLHTAFGLSLSSYRNELAYFRLEEAFTILRRLGASASNAIAWAKLDAAPPSSTGDLANPPVGSSLWIATSVTQAARAKYDDDGWSAVARPMRDQLRKRQREVLVSYLVGKDDLDGSDELFKQLYLDVEIGPVQVTSRAVSAAATIQAFVQRSLMNLDDFQLSTEAAREWRWMKSYRVWEAARKVFLYPENYLDPALRTDKSPLFEAFEQKLRQGELTLASAEEAYRLYLDGLAEIANLEIVAVHEQILPPAEFSIFASSEVIVHVFGRTPEPHKLFHRMRRGARWGAWRRVELEAKSNHFVCVNQGGKLVLIWLVTERVAADYAANTPEGQPTPMQDAISIAYATRGEDGVWSKVATTPRSLWKRLADETADFAYLEATVLTNGRIQVWVGQPNTYDPGQLELTTALFELNMGTGEITSQDGLAARQPYRSVYSAFRQRWRSSTPALELVRDDGVVSSPFWDSRSSFELSVSSTPKPNSYCYRDDRRTLYIEGHRRPGTRTFLSPVETPSGFDDLNAPSATYSVQLFFHPFVNELRTQLVSRGLRGLLTWSEQSRPLQLERRDISDDYKPTPSVGGAFPMEELEFRNDGAYSLYNWELFLHAPLQIAKLLMRDQRFEEAQQWLHYLFDPTDGTGGASVRRFWKVKPFYENQELATLLEELTSLAVEEWTDAHHELNHWFHVKPLQRPTDSFIEQISVWHDDPFDPHGIARLRVVAYQKLVVMTYVENLIAWGDQLFARDSLEATNEATQLYLLAREILGARPIVVDNHDATEGKTFAELEVDDFGNAIQIEAVTPPSPAVFSCASPGAMLPQVWGSLYFCIPQNEKLLGLWDTIDDRLYKLRNALNIEGIQRVLPLFAPPIDPALLVRAAAAGLDIGAVLNDTATSAGPYRYFTYAAKALELAQVVSSYGQAFLSALEKRDSEGLSNLRLGHEVALHDTIKSTRQAQIDAAKSEVASLQQARKPVEKRLDFYRDVERITGTESTALVATSLGTVFNLVAEAIRISASTAAVFPQSVTGGAGMASPVQIFMFGGTSIAEGAAQAAYGFEALGSMSAMFGQLLATTASYERRWDEWKREENALNEEVKTIDAQILAAQLRQAVAESELATVNKQLEQSSEAADFALRKFTNDQLYDWQIAEMSALYFQAYKMAYDMARRAERAFQWERGDDQSFIQFGYWDSLKKGLLSGERLAEGLRRMDIAWHTQNTRELEITKHVPLSKHAPLELLKLRQGEVAKFRLSETDFDLDFPTHYLRRVKSAAVSLQCTTGPYESVSGTLALASGETRPTSSSASVSSRFNRIQSIVTSGGRDDAGLFEVTLRDDRTLPFEGVGAHAASGDQWSFELSQGNELDFSTITDLVLHLRYTARAGRTNAFPAAQTRYRLIDLRSEQPEAWQALLEGAGAISFSLPKSSFIGRRGHSPATLLKVSAFARWGNNTTKTLDVAYTGSDPAVADSTVANMLGATIAIDGPGEPITDAIVYSVSPGPAPHTDLLEAWLLVAYK